VDTRIFFTYPSATAESRGPAPRLLDDAGQQEWEALLSHMQTRNLRPGETLLAEGVGDRALYLLTDGRLELSSSRTPLVTVQAPAPLNEIAFLDGGPCTSTVRAVGEAEVLRLSFDAFESLAVREPTLARQMLLDLGRIVADRLRSSAG
jgi:CRP/FNR family transcriptional regulator, cyclic AMP receptor protein